MSFCIVLPAVYLRRLPQLSCGQGGVVFGATMDEDTREVYHAMVENEKELDKLRMSKYYQSDTRDVYQIVRAKLQEGHQVLFSGTACQVAALYRFLGDKVEWPKLITVDVLCHGGFQQKGGGCPIFPVRKNGMERKYAVSVSA